MKKGKIAVITACAVVLILGGVIALSRAFENSWQNENTIDNSLNVEIVDSSESVFNYPYINAQILENDKSLLWNNILGITSDVVPVPENAISYQEAANIAGEAIQYITGYMNHQKSTAFVDCQLWHRNISDNSPLDYSVDKVHSENLTVYKYVILEDTDNDKYFEIDIYATVDPFTKEIYSINFKDENYRNTAITKEWTHGINDLIAVNEPLKTELLTSALAIKGLCNNKSDISHYRVYECESHYGVVFIPTDINTKITVLFSKGETPMFFNYRNSSVGGHYNHLIEEY